MSQTEHHHHHHRHHHHSSNGSESFKKKSLNAIKYRKLIKKWLFWFLVALALVMAALVIYVYTVN